MIAIYFGLSSFAAAQDYRGKVQGTVADANDAVIAGAQVVLHNNQTGVDVTRQSNDEGNYRFDFVDPGEYTITVQLAGYKKAEQQNVIVQQRGDVTADIKMSVGEVTEVVTVEAPPVQVEFNTTGSAITIDNKIIDQLPIRGRNPYNISTLDPTVSPGTGNTANENRPYHHAFANDFDAGGGTRSGNDVLLDGVPLTSSFKTSYTPNMDGVQEVTFQKNAVDAEYGYSAGGIIILNMKSGTNDFHGTAFTNFRRPRFNAVNDPTLVRTEGADETRLRGTKLSIYGGSLGGRIITNKLFFFTTYEKWKDAAPLSSVLSVPTALERTGNFSQSVRGGVVRNIFDPFTSTGTNGARTQFAGNIIPANRIDPVAARLFALLPLPNVPGATTQNLQVSKTTNTDYWNFSTRVDWNPTEKWKSFVRYGQFKANLLEDNPTEAALLPVNGSNRYGLSIAADTVYTLSPTTVLNLRGNYHQLTDEYAADTALLGDAGLQALFPNTSFYNGLITNENVFYPAIDIPIGGNNRFGRPGREFYQRPQGWGFSARLNHYLGNHSMKFGGEMRVDKGKGARFEPLNFFFRQNLTANQNTNPNLVTSGNEWATFLLGALEPNGTGNTNNNFVRRTPLQEVVSFGYAGYFQDDWKVNDRISLNLGLRWEYEPGPVDAQNRLSRMIDLTSPIPEFQTNRPAIPAVVTNILATKGFTSIFNGAWQFTDENNRNAWERDKLNLLPRFGMAFKINDQSVLRFGYARYMAPSQRIRDPLGDFVEQYTGFATTTFVAPLVNGVPQARLSNPFPTTNPVQQPTGTSLGRYTNLGNSFMLDALEQQPPVNDRFTLSYQRQIWGRVVLDLDYFFNTGHDLPYTLDLNMVDPSFGYTIPRSVLNQQVDNPFFNILTPQQFPGALRNQSRVTVASLLRPYPQYGAINQANTPGRSERLHSFSIQGQRPFSKGLSFIMAYAYNRERTTEFYDEFATFERRFEWFETETPRHRFTNAITWDLPVGRGRWLLTEAPRAVDMVLGGWQLTTTTRLYSGRLLQFGNLIVSGDPRITDASEGPSGRWFDPTVFSALPTSTNASDPPNLVRRTNPRYFDGLYGPSSMQTDMTLSKGFQLSEQFKLEARVESYNVFNRINWDNPGVTFTDPSTFGKVTRKSQAYTGREMQFGMRLVF